ncbi:MULTISPECIES: hypothetical protein [unclassified Amycolatopsis]|uniref:hypothetical protein n=1 Tax=unclassified Amycolatopsis TaxID=2618356 RepID=UPI002874A97F|nr:MULTISPECIES: hypothetical protein [unclassified Amycolatopsis]MDS0135347.1 hypothetical protein [Amycolatopsis sp. 505]MDS0140962.1 hypothetical protein [Amycolatopsis sp. CM201R]
MTTAQRRVNPFVIPGREDAPRSVLCPWREPNHTELYVEIDNYAPAFREFKDQFASPQLLKEACRLALVGGESGCGKSALRNMCAHWLQEELGKVGLRGEIFDLAKETDALNQGLDSAVIDIKARMGRVCSSLLKKLATGDFIDGSVRDDLLGTAADAPHEVYAELAAAMADKDQEDVVPILLLPATDMRLEMERYLQMPGSRIVFFAEAVMSTNELSHIGAGQNADMPPATVSVGTLSPADVQLFITTRTEQRRKDCAFPSLHEELVEYLAAWPNTTVAGLQSHLTGVYDHARRTFTNYTNDTTITKGDMTDYTMNLIDNLRARR